MLPDSPFKLPGNSDEAALAAFITGCLVFAEVIIIDESDHRQEKVNDAIRVIAACLRETKALPKHIDAPELPFEY